MQKKNQDLNREKVSKNDQGIAYTYLNLLSNRDPIYLTRIRSRKVDKVNA